MNRGIPALRPYINWDPIAMNNNEDKFDSKIYSQAKYYYDEWNKTILPFF